MEEDKTTNEIICGLEESVIFPELVPKDIVILIRNSQINIKKKIIEKGSEHPSVLINMCELAELYISIFYYNNAEEILLKTYFGYRRIYRNRNVVVVVTLSRLAFSLQQQRRFSEAEKCYKESLEGLETHLGTIIIIIIIIIITIMTITLIIIAK